MSDNVVAMGGTSILTEVPEMFGAEVNLLNRCENIELFNKASKMINDFKEYFLSHGQPVGENPSPGNKEGGITTLEDKSLGCVQKSGLAPSLFPGDGFSPTGCPCDNQTQCKVKSHKRSGGFCQELHYMP